MAKVQCRCGEILSNHQFPNDIELIVYTSRQWESVEKALSYEDTPEPDFDVWKCSNCERLLFFDEGKLIKTYSLESNN